MEFIGGANAAKVATRPFKWFPHNRSIKGIYKYKYYHILQYLFPVTCMYGICNDKAIYSTYMPVLDCSLQNLKQFEKRNIAKNSFLNNVRGIASKHQHTTKDRNGVRKASDLLRQGRWACEARLTHNLMHHGSTRLTTQRCFLDRFFHRIVRNTIRVHTQPLYPLFMQGFSSLANGPESSQKAMNVKTCTNRSK